MGYSKCMEDNLEIMDERLTMMEFEKQECRQQQAKAGVATVVSSQTQTKLQIAVTKRPKHPVRDIREPEYQKQVLVCKCCGKPFTFSVKAQRLYWMKGWSTPRSCKPCRAAKKAQRPMLVIPC